jgi:Popeye protein conserved region
VADWCIHAANVIYLASYLTRDMMFLRVFTCAGLALGIMFFACQPVPLYGPCVWQVLFFGINLVQIRRLIQERRRVKLSEEREQVANEAFKDLSRDEMLNLLTRAMCAQAEKLPDLRQAAREPLSEDEAIVRDIAFRGLSNKELLNLLTRRLWNSLWWVNPARWRLRRPDAVVTPLPAERERTDPQSIGATSA